MIAGEQRAAHAERAAVRLESLTVHYGQTTALDAVDLDVPEGSLFSVLGPSGCGKTTMLRALGGFVAPSSGRVFLGGRDVTADPPHRRGVATVFQSYALFPHLTVAGNVAYGLRRRGIRGAQAAQRVAEALALVGLPEVAGREVGALSGGQQQRVAVARALVTRPQVLLLDEPLGALDEELRARMQRELRAIQREVGITFLYVTHDQAEALAMSDLVAVMRRGRIVQAGTPRQIYASPKTAFVARFLGGANLLPGEVATRTNTLAQIKIAEGVTVFVPDDRVNGKARITVGVRPESFSLGTPDAPPVEVNRVPGRVRDATYVGSDIRCTVDAGHWVIAARVPAGTYCSPGQDVILGWRPEDSFVVEEEADA